ncbi:cytochrome P450 78A5-like, partial [Dioscorea cayenensis subsp. rotundata]|uniref:Cytochrome P450 78A5-like n=1 Tax=Dioscorea cayennensis subsp. rotundata TaxID=55577 RepID=A0AB40CPK5_DIOCR
CSSFTSPQEVSLWACSSRSPPHSRIPGPPGTIFSLSGPLPHRALAKLSTSFQSLYLMAFSIGFTRFIISSHPDSAKEILNNSSFADRPIKESAYELLFHRAMGFAPFGDYWRTLRRLSSTHLFSPKKISSLAGQRMEIGTQMVAQIDSLMRKHGKVELKQVLHFAALNSIMMSVFGKKYEFGKGNDGLELEELVKEGYELLGVFNWSDHLPLIGWFDFQGVRRRCKNLIKKVDVFVLQIIKEHRERRSNGSFDEINADFVDVLLHFQSEEKLSDSDIIAVLWEMIFRGTDTVAILLEWIMARMVLHPEIQSKAQLEIENIVGSSNSVSETDIPKLHYLQSIVKECLRLHPPGPLLSWARLAIHDTFIGDNFVPAGTTAMVNMWAITHDESIWHDAEKFKPERFMDGEDVSVMGSDLRIAPFGSGRRVCPGKTMALANVHLWLAQLLQRFKWEACEGVDLSECLKMSLEMKNSLVCKVVQRS